MSEHSSPTELTAILADHKLWLYANGGKRANLRGANLYGADLRRADLRDANLRGADLRGADLRGADLRDANLYDANLRGANLRGANLYGANLRGADLRAANLYDADLRGADLRRADLTNTCVVLLLDDDGRYYQVVAHAGLTSDGEALYLAGCRQLTITGARKHWTDPDHNNPEAAARILAAVEAHHTAWENAR